MATSGITYDVLMKLHENYQPTQKKLTSWKGKEESQSVWFEMTEEFKSFLQELLNEEQPVSGLRIYFGQYDETTIPPGFPAADYLNKLTIGMIATDEENGKQVDRVNTSSPDAISGYNHGKICPPDICP